MDILRRHNIAPRQTMYAVIFLLVMMLFCKLTGFPLIIPFLLLFLGVHLSFFQKAGWQVLLRLGLLLTLIVFTAYNITQYSSISPLYIPVSSVAILTMLLFKDLQLSFVMALASSVLVSLVIGMELNFALIMLLGSLAGIYFSRDARTRGQLISTGFAVGIVQVIGGMLLFPDAATHFARDYVLNFVMPLAVNGLISVFFISAVLKIFESLFGELTNFSLMELSDFNQPLLRRMILEAPGTYHHSLIVSNLAEAAADAIGANGLLARVGAYYHDIGKMEKAEYFTENQIAIGNKHDDIEPSISKLVILNHVRDGMELARKYKLNQKIVDFIPQHHGTTLMHYFYRRALEGAEDVEDVREETYRYPGPKPQTKETAIVLLADSAEAATRSLAEPSPQNINEVVHKVVNNKFIDAQLDECTLTLKEIEIITENFIRILSAMYHSRVRYPEIKNGSESSSPQKTE